MSGDPTTPARATPSDAPRVRAVLRLVVAAFEPDDGPDAQAARLFDGLAKLLDADAWSFERHEVGPDGSPGRLLDGVASDPPPDPDLDAGPRTLALQTVGREPDPHHTSALLVRGTERPAFAARERDLFELIVRACGPLHRAPAVPPPCPSLKLTPRQRDVLMHLLEGRSIKQVAYRMGLSFHTANGHVKDIHRRLGVKKRSELLRMFS